MIRICRALIVVIPTLVACEGSKEAPPIPFRTIDAEEIRPLPVATEFTGIRDIVPGDGSLWILDSTEPFIARIDLDDHGWARAA
jgi:hypothetical protein